ncbi:hypothetical protein BOTBODRAFT_33387 [Botryobasidium botryosum FD-172 SS1]|uniref:Uncharacterized protein n=1 Tax=Botryobasidium botryosum (strain FD-172 SS1) TaxID=930990 RepID=A0A067MDN9_BOTB1|nr:hypothetical protein BOTBODRAFT_33387 [Botryobasidium botryosum FD-172 SS1]
MVRSLLASFILWPRRASLESALPLVSVARVAVSRWFSSVIRIATGVTTTVVQDPWLLLP